jgi:hypothetical protein
MKINAYSTTKSINDNDRNCNKASSIVRCPTPITSPSALSANTATTRERANAWRCQGSVESITCRQESVLPVSMGEFSRRGNARIRTVRLGMNTTVPIVLMGMMWTAMECVRLPPITVWKLSTIGVRNVGKVIMLIVWGCARSYPLTVHLSIFMQACVWSVRRGSSWSHQGHARKCWEWRTVRYPTPKTHYNV